MKLGEELDVVPLRDSPNHFCGVYAIVNAVTNRTYIGSSSSVGARMNAHKRYLNDYMRVGLSHANKELQDDWDIYGEDIFEFILLEACPVSHLTGREQAWINIIDPGYLYNMKKAANAERKIDADLASDIRELKESGHTNQAVAQLLNISEREIHNVVAAAYN